jgi:hypothetical protein
MCMARNKLVHLHQKWSSSPSASHPPGFNTIPPAHLRDFKPQFADGLTGSGHSARTDTSWKRSNRSLCLPDIRGAILQPGIQFAIASGMHGTRGGGDHTAHGLCHSAATILLNHVGKDLREIQELLRHKKYSHHCALYPRRLRADHADRGSPQRGVGLSFDKLSGH